MVSVFFFSFLVNVDPQVGKLYSQHVSHLLQHVHIRPEHHPYRIVSTIGLALLMGSTGNMFVTCVRDSLSHNTDLRYNDDIWGAEIGVIPKGSSVPLAKQDLISIAAMTRQSPKGADYQTD